MAPIDNATDRTLFTRDRVGIPNTDNHEFMNFGFYLRIYESSATRHLDIH